jgi:hypothetical protein
MSDIVSYTLKHPFDRLDKDGNVAEKITCISLRRPKGKQMKAMDNAKGSMSRILALLAVCGGLLPVEVDAMDGEDIMALSELITGFLGQSLPTGEM